MEIQEYLKKKKKVQEEILNFIDNEDDNGGYFQSLERLFNDLKIFENKSDLTELFHMILVIANDHHRSFNFYTKIDKILLLFKKEIMHFFSTSEIINIFQSNKRIICFFLQETIISSDELNSNEIMSLFNEENKLFQMNDKINEGENDHYICQIIRKDLIDDFISYINQNNIPLSSQIESSIFETNLFLINKTPSLIEYSSFFGSIRIFKYLIVNGINLTSELLVFAIHGRNPEIIHHLEDNNIQVTDKIYNECLNEAIKCHHNEIADYILNNFNRNENNTMNLQSLESFNYYYFSDSFNVESIFYDLCSNDYCSLVKILLKTCKFDLNKKIISIIINS